MMIWYICSNRISFRNLIQAILKCKQSKKWRQCGATSSRLGEAIYYLTCFVYVLIKLIIFFRNPIPETNDKLDNVKWETYSLKDEKYMDIGNKLVMQEKLYDKRYKEWETLFPLSKYSYTLNKLGWINLTK